MIAWHLAVLAIAAGAAYAMRPFMEDKLVITMGVLLAVLGTIVLGVAMTRPLMSAAEFLARAILHVSAENSGALPPDPKTLKASREFLERLASYVYDMASKSEPSKNDIEVPDQVAKQVAKALHHHDAFDALPIPSFVIDKNNAITEANQAGLKYIGLTADRVVNQPFYDVLKFSFTSDDTLENWLSFAAEKSVSASRSWERVRLSIDDGPTKQLDMAARYSKNDSDGREVIISLFDHTEKYGKDDSGASFVSMAVHELRTPLTIMRGYIEVFEDELADKLDSEQSEFLRNLNAQAQQLGAFVSNIQNLARIEENSLELHLKQESWNEILHSVIADMEIRGKVRHKEIKSDIPADLPMVAVDRTTIYEVMVNIIENAIKYTHTDAPVEIETHVKDGKWVETTIRDHGIGIPDSLLGHIFDKFYRSHRSSKSVGGTGLGLFIAKTIVEAHGGDIWVKTKEGEGTTFGFTVPTYESVADQINASDNKSIERSAHGWIKNHTMYRG